MFRILGNFKSDLLAFFVAVATLKNCLYLKNCLAAFAHPLKKGNLLSRRDDDDEAAAADDDDDDDDDDDERRI